MSSSTNDNQDNTAVQDAVIVAVNSTTVDDDNSGGGGGLLLGLETKVNDDDTDVLVDDTSKAVQMILVKRSVLLWKSTSCKIVL
jgi:hypothetical protein